MYKTSYVSFCIPAIAMSIAYLRYKSSKGRARATATFIYLDVILAALQIFYLGSNKLVFLMLLI